MSIFLDANVVLEIILSRSKAAVAKEFLSSSKGDLCISSLTGHLIMHFGKKIVSQPILRDFLGDFTMLALEQSDFDWAFQNSRNSDFEDALQLSVAIKNGCTEFITFDAELVKDYASLISIKVKLL